MSPLPEDPADRWPAVRRRLLWGVPAGTCLLVFALVRLPEALVVPLAGPWAARLRGHSCGMADGAPVLSWALVAAGLLCLALSHRVRRWWASVPLALWWLAWVATAIVSILNSYE